MKVVELDKSAYKHDIAHCDVCNESFCDTIEWHPKVVLMCQANDEGYAFDSEANIIGVCDNCKPHMNYAIYGIARR